MKTSLSKIATMLEVEILTFLLFPQLALAADDDIFGTVEIPEPLAKGYGGVYEGQGGTGLIGFASNLIKLLMIVAGLWAFINVLLAGFTYITGAHKPEELVKAHHRLYMSLIGLVIVVGSFAIAAIFGWLLFGDASAILSPKIYGPGGVGGPGG